MAKATLGRIVTLYVGRLIRYGLGKVPSARGKLMPDWRRNRTFFNFVTSDHDKINLHYGQ